MRALTLKQVCEKTALRRSFLYSLVAENAFPKQTKIGNRSVWDEAEVDAWLREKFARRAPQQGPSA